MSAAVDTRPQSAGAPGERHIVQLIETGGPGGAERVLVNLTEMLDRAGDTRATVGLLKTGWLADELRRRGLEVEIRSLARALDIGFLQRLSSGLKRDRVDLVHAHEFTMNFYGTLAARFVGVPAVATVHGKNYYAEAGRRVWAMRLLPRLGATVVAVSEDIRAFLQNELGIAPVRVIPNGIDISRYTEGSRSAARARLGLDESALVIGAVGNLYPVKGHATLLRAAAQLGRQVHVVIAGRGEEEERLRELAGELGLAERLHLLGFRDDVPELLCAFDVYALPSYSEGQSLALIEAMAARLPIVASRVGGNPEIIAEDVSGLLFEAGDDAGLALALAALLDDPDRARQLADAAAARAAGEFSLATMVRRYRELYRERGVRLAP